jgi:cell division protein FtsA
MQKTVRNLVAAIDLGSAKTCVVVAEADAEGLHFLGHGVAESSGTRRGVIVDISKAVVSLQRALSLAEQSAGVSVERAVVGIAGPHVRGKNSQGGITLSSRGRTITREDVSEAVARARSIPLPDNHQLLHLLPQEYKVDELDGVQEPLGMTGRALAVHLHLVTASCSAVQNVTTVANLAGIYVDDVVYEPLACADAVLHNDERELGVCLADLGAGSTDLIVFHEGVVRHAGVVPLGGDHFTSDVAVGLQTPLCDAENIKKQYGNAVVTRIPEPNQIEVPSGPDEISRLMPQRLLGEILQPRARELFEMVRDHLRQAGVLQLCEAGFVLTGGAARLAGLTDMVDQVLRRPARVGGSGVLDKLPFQLLAPEYSAALGLLRYEYRARAARIQQPRTLVRILADLLARGA